MVLSMSGGNQVRSTKFQRPQTHHQDDRCLAKEAEGKGDGLAKHVSTPEPYWTSVGHPQMEGGGAQGP